MVLFTETNVCTWSSRIRFQSSFMPLSVRKMPRRIWLKIITEKRQNQLSELIVWPLRRSKKGLFSLTRIGGWY